MDCSLPGSSIRGIFQARILEWVAISFSRESSQPRDWTQVFHTAGRLFTVWATREALLLLLLSHSSRVRPSATPWTATFQAPLPMGFSRQKYWSGVPLPSLQASPSWCYNVKQYWGSWKGWTYFVCRRKVSCRCHRVGFSWQNSQMVSRFISLVYVPCITPSTRLWEEYRYDKKKISSLGFVLWKRQRDFANSIQVLVSWLSHQKVVIWGCCWCAVTKSCPTHGFQCTKLLCPSLSSGVCSNSCLLSRWY